MHGGDIGKTSASTSDGKRRVPIAAEEEQPRIFKTRIGGLFIVRINVVKNAFASYRAGFEIVADLYRLIRIDMAVPCHGETAERIARIIPFVHREDQSAVVAEYGLVDDGGYRGIGGIGLHAHIAPYPTEGVVKIFLLCLRVV